MVASGPSSGSKDGVPRRREPQLEEETEIKPEPKVELKLEEKKQPSPKGTLSLALQRIHDKLPLADGPGIDFFNPDFDSIRMKAAPLFFNIIENFCFFNNY